MGAENNTQTDKPRFVGKVSYVPLGELVSNKAGKHDANVCFEEGYPVLELMV